MGFSPLAAMGRRIPDVGRSQPRNNHVVGVLVHHNAGVDAYGQATAPGREVSAQYWITNAGIIIPNIDESRRAFTSGYPGYPGGAQADHRMITVEVSNDGGPGWSISTAAEDALARLIGDVHRRYNLGPVVRGTQRGVAVHRDFVPTECPGPYVMANLGRIITAAERHRNQEDIMTPAQEKKLDRVLAAIDKLPARLLDESVPRRGTDKNGQPRTGRASLRSLLATWEHQVGITRRIVERIDVTVKKLTGQ